MGFSGFGKFNGPEGLRECCNQKVLMNDRFSFLKSQIPKPLQCVSTSAFPPVIICNTLCRYPVSPNAVGGARIILNLIYGAGVARKLRAAKQFAAMLFGRQRK